MPRDTARRAPRETAERLDVALVARGLVRSRSAAATAVAAGAVRVDGRPASRASQRVRPESALDLDRVDPWVGRAAGKLDAALDAFAIPVAGRSALDLGASTGGFTQVLLGRGSASVVALDVGHGQLVPELRADPRVVVVEGENARDLDAARWAALTGALPLPELIVADLSFISLTLVLPAVALLTGPGADVVVLVKPQFEVGRGRTRAGVVVDPEERAAAVRRVLAAAAGLGLRTAGVLASPVPGTHGNREVLVHLHRSRGTDPTEWSAVIGRAVLPAGEAR